MTTLDAPPTKPERRPGDFDRDANGTPWVSHPDGERTKPKRKGDEGTIKRVRYARPSGYGEQILDSYNLQKWSERMIMAGVSHGLGTANEQRLLKLAPPNNDDAEWRKEADSLAKLAKEAAKHMIAAERGTHTHTTTEYDDTERDWVAMADEGVDLGLSVEVQRSLVEAWRTMLDTHGIEILATELAVVHDGYRCAGTLDRIVRLTRTLTFVLPGGELVTLPAGWVGVLDLKTGKLRHTNGEVGFWDNYPIQIAIYAGSTGYDTEAEQRYELPWTIDQRWAIIAHLDVLVALDGDPSCELILVDLELGRQGADLVQRAKAYEKADKFSLVGTCNVADGEPATANTGDCDGCPQPTDGCPGDCPPRKAPEIQTVQSGTNNPLRANLLARAKTVAAIDANAGKQLIHYMTAESLPKLGSDGPITDEQFARIERLIQEAEAVVSAPFADLPAEPLPEVPSVAVERPVTLDVTVDHGATVDPQTATYQELAAAVGRLDPAGRAWLQQVRSEAQAAGRDFHVSTNPTVRNVRIVTGLAMLAALEMED